MPDNTDLTDVPTPILGTPGSNAPLGTDGADQNSSNPADVPTPVFGTPGNDAPLGTDGADQIFGLAGADLLIGGNGADIFLYGGDYNGDPFDGATPDAPAEGQIPGVSNPDTIADFTVADDAFSLDGDSLGLQGLSFANAPLDLMPPDANVMVLQDEFADPSAAAEAIAGNDALTGRAGVFLFHDATLDFNRLVYSSDPGGGGAYSVLAGLTNQAGDAGTALLPSVSPQNFDV